MSADRKGPGTPAGTGVTMVAVAAALWGTDALFRRGLALELPASSVVFAEHLILVLMCAPLAARVLRAARAFDRRDWVSVILIGVGASAVATALFTAAFRYGDPTTPLLLQKLQPVVAVLGARLVLGERLLPRYAVYFALALCGSYFITFPAPTQVSVSRLTPALLAVGAASLWGMGTVLGRGMTARVDVLTLTALRFTVGLPASALMLLLLEGPTGFTVYQPTDVTPLMLLALIPGLLSLALYYRGLSRTPAAAATLAELAFPLSAVLINYVAFGERLSPTQWLGVAVLSGTITALGWAGQRDTRRLGVNLQDGRARPLPSTG